MSNCANGVVLVHSNMRAWTSARFKSYSTGYIPHGGQVRNPFGLSESLFGSSPGFAAAASAKLVPVAVGTETDSSIVGPAGINGIVGIYSPMGLTSRTSVIPNSKLRDTVGTFGRTVADAVTVLWVIGAFDEAYPFTMVSNHPDAMSYLRYPSDAQVIRLGTHHEDLGASTARYQGCD